MNEELKSVILKKEIITDQADPRMIEFRKSQGEFESWCKRKTVRLEITEHAPSPGKLAVTTKFGYYEGEPPPGYWEAMRSLYSGILVKVADDKKGKGQANVKSANDVLSEEHQRRWKDRPIYSKEVLGRIDKGVHLHREVENVRSSAGACLNTIGNIANNKKDLINFLNHFDLNVEDIYPFPTGSVVGGRKYGDIGNVVFEWVGPSTSPLNERGGGRGLNRTSIDAFILAKINGKVTQLLIEWKFTETYGSPYELRKFSGVQGNERLRRYSICLAELRRRNAFPFGMQGQGGLGLSDLGYEPFYQLLRMTLLAKLTTPLELEEGLTIQDYRVVHLSHSKNTDLNLLSPKQLSYCPGLSHCAGKTLHEVWRDVILSEDESKRFRSGYWDQAVNVISDGALKDYLMERYVA